MQTERACGGLGRVWEGCKRQDFTLIKAFFFQFCFGDLVGLEQPEAVFFNTQLVMEVVAEFVAHLLLHQLITLQTPLHCSVLYY